MILADKIINERKKNGWSQEELADMLDVSRQSVSKWEGAQSVPDLQKILKLAEIFGVSTDYLLKDEMSPESPSDIIYEEKSNNISVRRVSLEEASDFISIKKKILPKIGLGTFLCITNSVVLIFLTGLSESVIPISNKTASAIGMLFLFVQTAFAMYLFLSNSGKLKNYDFLENEAFETCYGVDGMIREKISEHEPAYSKALTFGVLLCIFSCVPLVIVSIVGAPGYVITSMVCLLLILIGVAIYMFISVCGINDSYHLLLQDGEYTYNNKIKNRKLEALSSIYWLLITVIYFALSFYTGKWGTTWMIWPIAGVLFALIRKIAKYVFMFKE